MKLSSNTKLFLGAILVGFVAIIGPSLKSWQEQRLSGEVLYLEDNVSVSQQIQLRDIKALRLRGFAGVIDLRPNGEAPDEPSSALVGKEVAANGMSFAYVPVQHGDIPPASVDALAKALAEARTPVVLYCRSGRRAVRTWSLVEASKPGGLSASSIQRAAQNVGQSVDDLMPVIKDRIANRPKQEEKIS